jgi:hypothetical protein
VAKLILQFGSLNEAIPLKIEVLKLSWVRFCFESLGVEIGYVVLQVPNADKNLHSVIQSASELRQLPKVEFQVHPTHLF